jgi:hypothetical protein
MYEPILKLAGTLLLTYSTHYGATKLYTTLCVPDGFTGYIYGIFTTGSPICSATLSYISNSQSSYSAVITSTLSRAIIDTLLPGTGSGT